MVLFRRAQVYAPEPLGLHDILVAGGQIQAIGTVPLPPMGWPVEVVDLEGAIVIPGVIDAHTHLCGGGGEGGPHTRVPALQPRDLVTAGVTTAIGLLGTDTRTRSIAELLAAARGLAHYGVDTLCYTGGYDVPPVTLTGDARNDIVHVDRIVAIGEVAISDHRSSQPTFQELVRLAADAHVAGMMTGKAGLLHLHVGDGLRGLGMVRRALAETELPPRVFHPTHCNRNRRLWEEAKDLAKKGLVVDVTAFAADGDAPSGGQAIAEWVAGELPLDRLTLSSDGGGCLPHFDRDGNLLGMAVGRCATLLASVREAVTLGVSLDVAVATCTRNVARQFRLHDRGHIANGKRADLVVLDPGMGIRHCLAAGRWLVRDGAPVVRGLFEPA